MLPKLEGKHVVDLGCGFGWASRWMRENGAASVLGVDLSENMVARAKADTVDPTIEYRIADIDTLELPVKSFDLVYSALTFHYVADFSRLVRMVHEALKAEGDFVFTIEHPIFMAAARPHWITDEDGRKTWPVSRYAVEGERRTDWFAKGVLKYHRRLATTINTLVETGFAIRRVDEFAPTREQVEKEPGLAEEGTANDVADCGATGLADFGRDWCDPFRKPICFRQMTRTPDGSQQAFARGLMHRSLVGGTCSSRHKASCPRAGTQIARPHVSGALSDVKTICLSLRMRSAAGSAAAD